MSHPSLLRPSSHGTEQNTRRSLEKRSSSYILYYYTYTIYSSTVIVLCQTWQGGLQIRWHDMANRSSMYSSLFFTSKDPPVQNIMSLIIRGAVQILFVFGQQSLSWVSLLRIDHWTSRAACLCVSSAFVWSAQHSFLGFRMSVTPVSTGNKYASVQKKKPTESWQMLRNVLTRSVPSW